MSDIAKRIDAIIREALAPLLKQSGFKKKARNFYREHTDHIDVINVQASRRNDASEAQFTVNVGVYFPAVSSITNALPISGMPKEYDCTAHERIGQLSENKTDHWWKIDRTSDDSATANDLATQVEATCLPWLESMSNLEDVKQVMVIKKRSFIAAGIALHLGQSDDAQELFNQSLKEQPLARSKLVALAKKHCLEIDAP